MVSYSHLDILCLIRMSFHLQIKESKLLKRYIIQKYLFYQYLCFQIGSLRRMIKQLKRHQDINSQHLAHDQVIVQPTPLVTLSNQLKAVLIMKQFQNMMKLKHHVLNHLTTPSEIKRETPTRTKHHIITRAKVRFLSQNIYCIVRSIRTKYLRRSS